MVVCRTAVSPTYRYIVADVSVRPELVLLSEEDEMSVDVASANSSCPSDVKSKIRP